jgi:hypothetical protein
MEGGLEVLGGEGRVVAGRKEGRTVGRVKVQGPRVEAIKRIAKGALGSLVLADGAFEGQGS